MTAIEVADEICVTLDALSIRGTLRLYLFGSATRPDSAWSDIDLLIVSDVDGIGKTVREALSEICLQFPIDLLVMTVEEEAEFNFIQSEKCQELATFPRP